jgi:hypothetical protein
MACKATMPTTHWTNLLSSSEFAIRGAAAWRDRKTCDLCKTRARSEVREIDGKVQVLCSGCTPRPASSAKTSDRARVSLAAAKARVRLLAHSWF